MNGKDRKIRNERQQDQTITDNSLPTGIFTQKYYNLIQIIFISSFRPMKILWKKTKNGRHFVIEMKPVSESISRSLIVHKLFAIKNKRIVKNETIGNVVDCASNIEYTLRLAHLIFGVKISFAYIYMLGHQPWIKAGIAEFSNWNANVESTNGKSPKDTRTQWK